MADLTNATVTLLEPVGTTSATTLQRDHTERRRGPFRCSLRDLSAMRSVGVLGAVTLNGYTCRLQTSVGVKTGWRVEATLDGEDEARTYVVRKVTRGLHTTLTLEGA